MYQQKTAYAIIAFSPGNYTVNAIFDIHLSALPHSNLKKTKLSKLNRSLWLSSSDDVLVESKTALKILDLLETEKIHC